MTWHRPVRIAVGVLGLAAAAGLYFMSRDKATSNDTVPIERRDAEAETETHQGKDLRFDVKTGLKIGGVSYASRYTYPDGRTVYKGAVYSGKRGDRDYTMTADELEAKGVAGPAGDRPGQFAMKGHVRITGTGGLELGAEEATYVEADGMVTIPGPATFTHGQLKGSGVGGTFDQQRDVFWLLDQAHVIMAPDSLGRGGFDGTAKAIGLARAEHYMKFDHSARLFRGEDTLTADSVRVLLTPEGNSVVGIEMFGRSNVTRTGTARTPSAPPAPPEMHAGEGITLEMDPVTSALRRARLVKEASIAMMGADGRTEVSGATIEIGLGADGTTLTHLDARDGAQVRLPAGRDTPARLIQARTLAARGEEPRGLKTAIFDEGVQFTETRQGGRGAAPAARTASARTLTLQLAGALGNIEQAAFRTDVTFKDGAVTAEADEADYDVTRDSLKLRAHKSPTPRPKPRDTHVVDADQRITIWSGDIDVNLKSHDLKAIGGAQTARRAPSAGPAKPATPKASGGLLDDQRDMGGRASQVEYVSLTGRLTYTGGALVTQDENSIEAGRIVLDQEQGNLSASGSVVTKLVMTSAPGESADKSAGRTPTRVTAEEFSFANASRLGVYTGGAEMTGADGSKMSGDRIELLFAKDERALQTVEATSTKTGGVRVLVPGNRVATGLKMKYETAGERYVMEGTPVTLVTLSIKDGKERCDKSTGHRMTFSRTTADVSIINDDGVQTATVEVPCKGTIR